MGIGKRWILPALLVIYACMFMHEGAFQTNAMAEEPVDPESELIEFEKPIRSIDGLNHKRLGVILGTTHDLFTNSILDFTQLVYFDGPDQILDALYRGEVDALVDDLPVNRQLAKEHPDLYLIPEVLVEDSYAFAVRNEDGDLQEKISEIIEQLIQVGQLKIMQDKWIDGSDDDHIMPELASSNSDKKLRFGVSPISPPFCYPGPDGKPIGYEMELMEYIANKLDMNLNVVSMEFHELIPSLLEKKVDVIGSCLSVTPERAKILRYATPLYHGGVSIIVLEDPSQVSGAQRPEE